MSKYPNPSRQAFEQLAAHYPGHLMDWIESGKLSAGHLTHALEILGTCGLLSETVVIFLIDYLKHSSPIVREGAVEGLVPYLDHPEAPSRVKEAISERIEKVAQDDWSPGVREAAREALEGYSATSGGKLN